MGARPTLVDSPSRRPHVFGRITNVGISLAALAVAATAIAVHATQRTSPATPADAGVADNVIVVRGKPFFPIMLIDQCTPEAARRAAGLGVNVLLNEACPDVTPRDQLASLPKDALAVLPIAARGLKGPSLLGWTYPDEPENNGWQPSALVKAHPYARGNR